MMPPRPPAPRPCAHPMAVNGNVPATIASTKRLLIAKLLCVFRLLFRFGPGSRSAQRSQAEDALPGGTDNLVDQTHRRAGAGRRNRDCNLRARGQGSLGTLFARA